MAQLHLHADAGPAAGSDDDVISNLRQQLALAIGVSSAL